MNFFLSLYVGFNCSFLSNNKITYTIGLYHNNISIACTIKYIYMVFVPQAIVIRIAATEEDFDVEDVMDLECVINKYICLIYMDITTSW